MIVCNMVVIKIYIDCLLRLIQDFFQLFLNSFQKKKEKNNFSHCLRRNIERHILSYVYLCSCFNLVNELIIVFLLLSLNFLCHFQDICFWNIFLMHFLYMLLSKGEQLIFVLGAEPEMTVYSCCLTFNFFSHFVSPPLT